MPEIGEIKRGNEIRFGNEVRYKDNCKLMWCACENCGKERWVYLLKGEPTSLICSTCRNHNIGSGEKARNWHGGRSRDNRGYIKIYVPRSDPFFPMANGITSEQGGGYMFEHRLVMAKYLGRLLHRWEIIHHINGIKDDNRIENLQLVTDDRHKQITILEERIKYLENRVTLLEAENLLARGVQ